MSHRPLFAFTALLLLVGCGGGGTTGPGPGPGPGDPIALTSLPDPGRAVTLGIPDTGGVITATAADGTTLSLTIPPNALVFDTDITLTPLSSVTGVPYAVGMVAGVEIAPAGLEFAIPPTLTITPPAGVSLTDYHGFAIAPTPAGGAAVRNGAATTGQLASWPTFPQTHPSDPNIAAAIQFIPSVAAAFAIGIGAGGLQHLPAAVSWSRVAEEGDILDTARANGQSAATPSVAAALQALFDRDWPVIEAELIEAETNPALLDSARVGFERWRHEHENLGLEDAVTEGRIQEGLDHLSRAYVTAIDQAALACGEAESLTLLLRARQMLLLNLLDRVAGSAHAEIHETVQTCANYQLAIDEDLSTGDGSEDYRVRRTLTVPLEADANFFLSGQADWVFVSGDPPGGPGAGCCVESMIESQTVTAVVLKVLPPYAPGQAATDWRVIIDINAGVEDKPMEIFRVDCSGCEDPPDPPITDIPNTYWLLNWAAHYLPQRYLLANAWLIDDWTAGGGVVARRDLNRTINYDSLLFTEVGTWELTHTPAGP